MSNQNKMDIENPQMSVLALITLDKSSKIFILTVPNLRCRKAFSDVPPCWLSRSENNLMIS